MHTLVLPFETDYRSHQKYYARLPLLLRQRAARRHYLSEGMQNDLAHVRQLAP